MAGRRELFLDVGIVSSLFTCSGWGGHQELGLKIDLFKPLSLLSSPQRLDARGQPGVWACAGSVGALAVPASGLPWGVGSARSPGPIPACWPCRPVTAAGPAPVLFSTQVCAGCLCMPSSFARRVRNPFFLEIKPPASQTPPHECPPASQAGPVLPASVPCQPPAPAPLTGLCGCHQPTRTFPLLKRWSAWALSRPCGSPLAWSSQEQTGEACGLVGRGHRTSGTLPASRDSWRLSDRSVKMAFPLFCVPSATGCREASEEPWQASCRTGVVRGNVTD